MDDYKKCLRRLRKHFPPLLPVRVYLKDLSRKDCFAYTELCWDANDKPYGFIITVHSGLSTGVKVHFLIHEWAHAYSWKHCEPFNKDDTKSHHDYSWGLALSDIYREIFEKQK